MLYGPTPVVVVVGIGPHFALTVNDSTPSPAATTRPHPDLAPGCAAPPTWGCSHAKVPLGPLVEHRRVRLQHHEPLVVRTGNASSNGTRRVKRCNALTTAANKYGRSCARVDPALCNRPSRLPGPERLRAAYYFSNSACGVAPRPACNCRPDSSFPHTSCKGSGAERFTRISVRAGRQGSAGTYNRKCGGCKAVPRRGRCASFAKYALFTNVHTTGPNGDDIWFKPTAPCTTGRCTPQHSSLLRPPVVLWFVTSAGCQDAGRTSVLSTAVGVPSSTTGTHFRPPTWPPPHNPTYGTASAPRSGANGRLAWRPPTCRCRQQAGSGAAANTAGLMSECISTVSRCGRPTAPGQPHTKDPRAIPGPPPLTPFLPACKGTNETTAPD